MGEQEYELRSTGIQSHPLHKSGYITKLCFELCRRLTLSHIQWRVGARVWTLQADGLDLNPGSCCLLAGSLNILLTFCPSALICEMVRIIVLPLSGCCVLNGGWYVIHDCQMFFQNWSVVDLQCCVCFRCIAKSSKANVIHAHISTLFKDSFHYRLLQGNWV